MFPNHTGLPYYIRSVFERDPELGRLTRLEYEQNQHLGLSWAQALQVAEAKRRLDPIIDRLEMEIQMERIHRAREPCRDCEREALERERNFCRRCEIPIRRRNEPRTLARSVLASVRDNSSSVRSSVQSPARASTRACSPPAQSSVRASTRASTRAASSVRSSVPASTRDDMSAILAGSRVETLSSSSGSPDRNNNARQSQGRGPSSTLRSSRGPSSRATGQNNRDSSSRDNRVAVWVNGQQPTRNSETPARREERESQGRSREAPAETTLSIRTFHTAQDHSTNCS